MKKVGSKGNLSSGQIMSFWVFLWLVFFWCFCWCVLVFLLWGCSGREAWINKLNIWLLLKVKSVYLRFPAYVCLVKFLLLFVKKSSFRLPLISVWGGLLGGSRLLWDAEERLGILDVETFQSCSSYRVCGAIHYRHGNWIQSCENGLNE